jgi:hypothetical protein
MVTLSAANVHFSFFHMRQAMNCGIAFSCKARRQGTSGTDTFRAHDIDFVIECMVTTMYRQLGF